jgi:tetratricopeptide (TPR) repeat protein
VADPPSPSIEASGARSIAAGGNIGIAITGDHAYVDARTFAGTIPAPAEVAAAPGTHNLPRLPTQVFVGRNDPLSQLSNAPADNTSALVTQVIYGLGGIGKSELALQYATAHQADYTLVWWITAEDAKQLEVGLATLAARLCPEIALAGTTADQAAWATAWLQVHHRWLLIIDNVNNPGEVEALLAQLTGGRMLITTRRDTGWDQIAYPIHLDVLDPGSAAELITLRTRQGDAADRNAAALIAAELGNLPLALDQAAAYITQTRIKSAAYLQRLQDHPAEMYAAAGSRQTQRTIARVWDITIEAIRIRQPAAIMLLHILACYAPDGVPRIILGGSEDTDQLAVDEALGMLASYSMISLSPDTVSMHRLVQAVILARHPPEDQNPPFGGDGPLTKALEWLNDAIPADLDTMAAWPLLRALVPHAETIATRFQSGSEPLMLGRVQNALGIFLDSQGQYEQALALHESALAITETVVGPEDPSTATMLGSLAGTYNLVGRPGEALQLNQRALAITEAARGPDHPDTALRLDNLAYAFSELGRDAEALPLRQRALEIFEAALGPDHPDTVTALSNIAHTYSHLGRYAEALPLQQRVLTTNETALGPDHPTTARMLGNVASTYNRLGRHGEALPLYQRALAILEKALGPDHPSTGIQLDNLAVTCNYLGRDAEALPLQERALAISEAAFGPDHPETAATLSNLAMTYSNLRRYTEALALQQRALAITEAALGPDHTSTAIRLNNLANTYSNLRRYAEALALQQRALAITEAALGPHHPSTAAIVNNLAFTYNRLGRDGEALLLQQRTLATTEADLGPDHLNHSEQNVVSEQESR